MNSVVLQSIQAKKRHYYNAYRLFYECHFILTKLLIFYFDATAMICKCDMLALCPQILTAWAKQHASKSGETCCKENSMKYDHHLQFYCQICLDWFLPIETALINSREVTPQSKLGYKCNSTWEVYSSVTNFESLVSSNSMHRKQDNSPQRQLVPGQLAPRKSRPKATRPRFRRQLAPLRNIINVYYYT